VAGVTAIVVSHNSRAHLPRCITTFAPQVEETIVVDAASTDGSGELVAQDYPGVTLVRLPENPGYGAAVNAGAARASASADLLLILNADTWAEDGAVRKLAAALEAAPAAGAAGPRLVNADGSLQPSVRGFPTPWRLATEYFFLRWLAPRSRALNAFYASGFDHETPRVAEFVVGAAMLLRRDAFEEVEGFDPAFFMYDEEVDLCYRLAAAGRPTLFVPSASVGHVGGASTAPVAEAMYIEQLRSHLRFLDKHDGPATAERVRRMLTWAMRLRALVFRGRRRRISLAAARWAASADVSTLLRKR
jgi:N-acetylglucosaminyl-diphospho-decaprenol L-rhamnosyltransferase